ATSRARRPHATQAHTKPKGLPQRREGQQPCGHWRRTARLRAIAWGQRLLQVGVEQLMAVRAPKHEKRPRLAGASGDCLLLRGQGNGRVPQNGLLTGGRDTLLSATSQSTDHPLLSTPLRALPKPLISVLGHPWSQGHQANGHRGSISTGGAYGNREGSGAGSTNGNVSH